MVAVLSSRISFRRGVGSRLSSSIRTERVSLEMRNCRSNFSRFKRPSNKREKKTDTSKFYTWFKKQFSHGPRSSPAGSSSASMHCKGKDLGLQHRLAAWADREWEMTELLQLLSSQKAAPKASWQEIRLLIQICSGAQSPEKFSIIFLHVGLFWLSLVAGG